MTKTVANFFNGFTKDSDLSGMLALLGLQVVCRKQQKTEPRARSQFVSLKLRHFLFVTSVKTVSFVFMSFPVLVFEGRNF